MQPSKELLIKGLKTRIITTHAPCAGECAFPDNLIKYVLAALGKRKLMNRDILVISSKVVAVTQNRIKKISNEKDFNELVEKEADKVIGRGRVTLTLKNGIFIPWAGIDRSNMKKGYAVLWPKQPFNAAEEIRAALKKEYGLRNLGVIISDSHCVPLRKGVTGIAIGYAGFKGVRDLRGKKDIYGNKLKVTRQNVADMLASAAHLLAGESDERIPFVLVRNAPVDFIQAKTNPAEPVMEKEKCLFSPLY